MKKFEIIIPHRRLDDVSEILKSANAGGMTHYRVEGRGKGEGRGSCCWERYHEIYSRIRTKD
jgi:nitrogen regulatory protein PII